jgi:hypothetical protein
MGGLAAGERGNPRHGGRNENRGVAQHLCAPTHMQPLKE